MQRRTRLVLLLAFTSLIISAIVLLGWALGISSLKSLLPAQLVALSVVLLNVALELKLKSPINSSEQADGNAKEKSRFLAHMSHEVRTPLNGLLGMAWLLNETPLNEEQRDYVARIQNSTSSLLRLIHDILDLSKIEAGNLVLERARFSTSELAAEAIKMLEHNAQLRGTRLELHLGEGGDLFRGDGGRIQHILANLISNAIKFTNKGLIQVKSSVQIIDSNKAKIRFSVIDNGSGIPLDLQASLFQESPKAEGSQEQRFTSTGLSLSISKKLVELMGGEMGFSSGAEGSEFWFSLPVEPIEVSNVIPLRRAPRASLNLLVVDDEENNTEILRRMLLRLGHTPHVAKSGKEGLAILEKTEIDFVLLDCNMPIFDGYETAKEIRRHTRPEIRQVHIIAVTANATPGSREKCLEAGMNDFLTKPYTFADLTEIVAAAKAAASKKSA